VDSRFCGNDKLCYVVVIERLTVLLGSKTVSLSNNIIDSAASAATISVRIDISTPV